MEKRHSISIYLKGNVELIVLIVAMEIALFVKPLLV
jgi:hypothetical protein